MPCSARPSRPRAMPGRLSPTTGRRPPFGAPSDADSPPSPWPPPWRSTSRRCATSATERRRSRRTPPGPTRPGPKPKPPDKPRRRTRHHPPPRTEPRCLARGSGEALAHERSDAPALVVDAKNAAGDQGRGGGAAEASGRARTKDAPEVVDIRAATHDRSAAAEATQGHGKAKDAVSVVEPEHAATKPAKAVEQAKASAIEVVEAKVADGSRSTADSYAPLKAKDAPSPMVEVKADLVRDLAGAPEHTMARDVQAILDTGAGQGRGSATAGSNSGQAKKAADIPAVADAKTEAAPPPAGGREGTPFPQHQGRPEPSDGRPLLSWRRRWLPTVRRSIRSPRHGGAPRARQGRDPDRRQGRWGQVAAGVAGLDKLDAILVTTKAAPANAVPELLGPSKDMSAPGIKADPSHGTTPLSGPPKGPSCPAPSWTRAWPHPPPQWSRARQRPSYPDQRRMWPRLSPWWNRARQRPSYPDQRRMWPRLSP